MALKKIVCLTGLFLFFIYYSRNEICIIFGLLKVYTSFGFFLFIKKSETPTFWGKIISNLEFSTWLNNHSNLNLE